MRFFRKTADIILSNWLSFHRIKRYSFRKVRIMTRKMDLRKSRLLERIGLKALLTVGVIVVGLFALPGTVHAAEANTPTITSQPQDLDLSYGYGPYYKVSVSAKVEEPDKHTLSYQWYEDGSAISGARSSSYTIPTDMGAIDDSIGFYCVVTATRKDIKADPVSVTSDTATVTIGRRRLSTSIIDISPSEFTYDGTTKRVGSYTLYNRDGELDEDFDFEVESESVFAAVGSPYEDTTYQIKFRGLGNYKGTATVSWTIKASSGGGSGGGPVNPPQPTTVIPPSPTPSIAPSSSVPSIAPSTAPSSTPSTAPSSAASKSSVVDSWKSALTKKIDAGIVDKVLKNLADNTKLADSEGALKSVLGESELSSLKAEGKSPAVQLTTTVMDKVSDEDKKLTETGIASYASTVPNLMPGAFLDINLKLNTTGDWQNVTTTKGPVKVLMNVPEEMQKLSDKFFVLRLHNGASTLLYDQDNDPKTVTIDSDQFSTYVLMYPGSDATAVKTGELKSRENTPFILWMVVGITMASILIFLVVLFFFYMPISRKKRSGE